MLKNKNILLGVTGGVAAYKAVDLVRRLKEEGASVKVIMTDASKHFITALSMEIASGNRVYSDLFENPMSHINLPRDADVVVVAPATANIIGKLANGIADDLLSTCLLSFIGDPQKRKGKVIIAPSMNWRMYENPVVQANLKGLAALGVIQVGPERGSLACGEEGIGRMADIDDLVDAVKSAVSRKDFSKKKIIVTAGPTREYFDPVRFISNRSSGKMGYAIARTCVRRGADVVLISGPSSLMPPDNLKSFVRVETAQEMRDAVFQNLKGTDIVIMSAAPADFSPEKKEVLKLDKSSEIFARLRSTPDILSELGRLKRRPLLVGFAAETGRQLNRARKKLTEKNADIIVFNDVTSPGAGFDVDTNRITIIEKGGETSFPLMSKDEVAETILDFVGKHIRKGNRKDF